MRYIRFLKTPRIIEEKNSFKAHVYCLVTITSDLGDSFLPYDVLLSAELLDATKSEDIIVWRTVQWTGGMRTLAVTLPLSKSRKIGPVKVRLGVEPKTPHDIYQKLADNDTKGVVSAWSTPIDPSCGVQQAIKFVERRFSLQDEKEVRIWEETGESIARHLWDAGITLSCHVQDLLSPLRSEGFSIPAPDSSKRLEILELGTGCGMVGLSIARVVQNATVILTDLPEAEEIVQRNIDQPSLAANSTINFQTLDWDEELPDSLQGMKFNLVIAADCTYNADSSPALVNTIVRLSKSSPKLLVAIAMKMRHSSEEVFFELITAAGFKTIKTISFPLPGDVDIGEEVVYLHIYRHDTHNRP